MRIAIVSDIHGNWTALSQVLPQIDAIIGAGDYLWTTAGDAKVVDWLQQVKSGYFVRGNGDCMAYYERYKGLAITDPYPIYDVVSRLPERLALDLAGYRVLIQHEWWVGDTCAERLMIASPSGEHWEPTPPPVCWRRGKGAVRTGEC